MDAPSTPAVAPVVAPAVYPAWFDLHSDPAIVRRPTALRVYALIVRRGPDVFNDPQPVKVWHVADQLHTSHSRVRDALQRLTRRGYLTEHGRTAKGIRCLTVVQDRTQSVSCLPVAA